MSAALESETTPVWRRPFLGGDGARGVGALMVFLAHAATAEGTYATYHWSGLPGRDLGALFGGNVGFHAIFAPARFVNLFFAFSAYLLGRPFIAWALGRSRRPTASKFFVRRFLRIMPAYWAVAGLLILWLVVLKGGGFPLGDSLGTLTLTRGGLREAGFTYGWAVPLEPAWTVRVELLGYLLLPLLAVGWWWAARRFGMAGLLIALVVTGTVATTVKFTSSQIYDGPGLQQWIFMPGLAVAVIEAHGPLQRWIAARGRWTAIAIFWIGVLLLLGSEPAQTAVTQAALPGGFEALGTADRQRIFLDAVLRGTALGVPMQMVGATIVLLGLVAHEWQGGGAIFRLDARIPRWFGERSYSFYLVHFGVLGGLLPRVATGDQGILGIAALAAVAFVVSLAMTVVLFRFVELPGMLLAARLTGRRPPGPLGVAEERPRRSRVPGVDRLRRRRDVARGVDGETPG